VLPAAERYQQYLASYIFAAYLNFYNTCRVVGDSGTTLESPGSEGTCGLSAWNHKECGAPLDPRLF
jgi:hypothetical protein